MDRTRGTAAQRGYDWRWQKARRYYLLANPLCVECRRHGLVVAATVVDHIQPHKGNMDLFWDEGNWQPLCKSCHDVKTLQEQGNDLRTMPGVNKHGMPTHPRHPWNRELKRR